MAVDKSGEYLGHCFGMDHHTSAMEKIMDDPIVREKLSDKIKDMLDFVIESETSAVFKYYPPEMHEAGGVAFEPLYLATNRNLTHSENLKVLTIFHCQSEHNQINNRTTLVLISTTSFMLRLF